MEAGSAHPEGVAVEHFLFHVGEDHANHAPGRVIHELDRRAGT
jgi:hypothetical protein